MTQPLATRSLGRTGLSVTTLGLGGAPLGDIYERLDDATAIATVVAAAENGISLFDTAPLYGQGSSEHRFGTALRRRPRDSYVLSTKVGRTSRRFCRMVSRLSAKARSSAIEGSR